VKEYEAKVLGAEERILQMESEMFSLVCRQVASETLRIQATARALACLDAVSSLAETAVRRRLVEAFDARRPTKSKLIHGRQSGDRSLNKEPFVSETDVLPE